MKPLPLNTLAFDAAYQGESEGQPRPLLMIAGTEAVTSWMTTDAFANAQQPKELFWIDGATHVALYDRNEYVTPAVTKLRSFFENALAAI